MEEEKNENKIFGPDIYQRNKYGLLKNVEYIFKEDGSVDWKKMIPKEYIVINEDYYVSKHKEVPKSIEEAEESGLLILLGGIKEIAKIRGIQKVDTRTVFSQEGRAVSDCYVTFIANYESNFEKLEFSGSASATYDNVNSYLGKYYLETIASNRAFVRAVRNALRIDIVGEDEVSSVGGSSNKTKSNSGEYHHGYKPFEALADKAGAKEYDTIDKFKKKLLSTTKSNKTVYSYVEGLTEEIVNSWTNWSDIEQDFVYPLLDLLNSSK